MIRPGERGAALLTVLLLVAVMGALAAAALERMRLSTALAANAASLDQARAFAIGVESLLALRIDDLAALSSDRTTLAGGWNGETRTLPMPGGGLAEATIRDGGNCFNVNSIVQGSIGEGFVSRPTGVAQFIALMRLLDIPEPEARRIADSAADWIDADTNVAGSGAEDDHYAQFDPAYRTGGTLFAEVSELRAVAGVAADAYARVRPWLCALPTAELSPINVNTLLIDQAPLLAMLSPDRIGLDRARSVIAGRPAAGWGSLNDFYRQPAMAGIVLPMDAQMQPQLRTRWFAVDLKVAVGGAELIETALIDARIAPARGVVRRWGNDD